MDDLLPLKEAARRVPGGPTTDVTLWRWLSTGLPNRSGQIVKLRHAAAGRRYLTTEAWMREFFERLGEDADQPVRMSDTVPPCRCAK